MSSIDRCNPIFDTYLTCTYLLSWKSMLYTNWPLVWPFVMKVEYCKLCVMCVPACFVSSLCLLTFVFIWIFCLFVTQFARYINKDYINYYIKWVYIISHPRPTPTMVYYLTCKASKCGVAGPGYWNMLVSMFLHFAVSTFCERSVMCGLGSMWECHITIQEVETLPLLFWCSNPCFVRPPSSAGQGRPIHTMHTHIPMRADMPHTHYNI